MAGKCDLCSSNDNSNHVYDSSGAGPMLVCYDCWQMSENHKKIFEGVAKVFKNRQEVIREEVRKILFVEMDAQKEKGMEP